MAKLLKQAGFTVLVPELRGYSPAAALLTRKWVKGEYEFKSLSDQSHWIPEQAPELLAHMIKKFIKP